MTKYNSLGLNIFKYNQAGLLGLSILVIGVNYMLGSSLAFWFLLFGLLLTINFIWYSFSDIKWNKEHFIIKKFLKKKIIASEEFIKVDRLFFNVFVIRFTGSRFYYVGDYKSVFENTSDINKRIKTHIQ